MICRMCWGDKDSIDTRPIRVMSKVMQVNACRGCRYAIQKVANYLNLAAIEQGILLPGDMIGYRGDTSPHVEDVPERLAKEEPPTTDDEEQRRAAEATRDGPKPPEKTRRAREKTKPLPNNTDPPTLPL